MGESESFLTKVQPGQQKLDYFQLKGKKKNIAHVIGQIILLPAPS